MATFIKVTRSIDKRPMWVNMDRVHAVVARADTNLGATGIYFANNELDVVSVDEPVDEVMARLKSMQRRM